MFSTFLKKWNTKTEHNSWEIKCSRAAKICFSCYLVSFQSQCWSKARLDSCTLTDLSAVLAVIVPCMTCATGSTGWTVLGAWVRKYPPIGIKWLGPDPAGKWPICADTIGLSRRSYPWHWIFPSDHYCTPHSSRHGINLHAQPVWSCIFMIAWLYYIISVQCCIMFYGAATRNGLNLGSDWIHPNGYTKIFVKTEPLTEKDMIMRLKCGV